MPTLMKQDEYVMLTAQTATSESISVGGDADVGSEACQHAIAAGTAFGAEAGTTFDFARLLVILAAPHLFLDSAPLHQFAEAPHRLLDGLIIPQRQFDHAPLLLPEFPNDARPRFTTRYHHVGWDLILYIPHYRSVHPYRLWTAGFFQN